MSYAGLRKFETVFVVWLPSYPRSDKNNDWIQHSKSSPDRIGRNPKHTHRKRKYKVLK